MAVSFRSIGALGAGNVGTTSLSINYPTAGGAPQSGDLLLLAVFNKYPTNGPSTPSGYSTITNGQASGGEGSAGIDAGTVYVTVFSRIADGTETGAVSVTITSGNSSAGAVLCYQKGSGTWDFAATNGSDNSGNSTSWSITGAADPGVIAGDMLIAFNAINSDGQTFSSQAFTQSGITFGTATERVDAGTNQGDDVGGMISDHVVSSGTSSGVPTYTATASASATNRPAGACVILRIREVTQVTIAIGAGALSLTGQSPTVVTPYTAPISAGALTATGYAPVLDSLIRISAGSLTFSGQVPTASAPHAIATPAGSLTLGGFSPTLDVSADRTVATGAGSMAVTGQAPQLLMVIPIAAASATLTGHAPAGTVSFVIPTAPGGLSLAGASPALLHSIAVGLSQMLLSGQSPSAVNPVTLSIGAGAVTLTASAPTLDIAADLTVAVGSASLALTGTSPAIVAPQVIAILPASMLLSGQIPGVNLSNILAVVIQMRPADNGTASSRNELQSNLVRMRHNLEVQ